MGSDNMHIEVNSQSKVAVPLVDCNSNALSEVGTEKYAPSIQARRKTSTFTLGCCCCWLLPPPPPYPSCRSDRPAAFLYTCSLAPHLSAA